MKFREKNTVRAFSSKAVAIKGDSGPGVSIWETRINIEVGGVKFYPGGQDSSGEFSFRALHSGLVIEGVSVRDVKRPTRPSGPYLSPVTNGQVQSRPGQFGHGETAGVEDGVSEATANWAGIEAVLPIISAAKDAGEQVRVILEGTFIRSITGIGADKYRAAIEAAVLR